MRLVLALACEHAHVRPDGRLDIRGVFYQLAAPAFPASQDRMTAVFVLEWAAEEAGRQPLRADLVETASGKPVLTIQGHTDVGFSRPGSPAQTRLVMPLENVVFPAEGRYEFRFAAGGERVSAFSIFLFVAGEEGGSGAEGEDGGADTGGEDGGAGIAGEVGGAG